jgi:hypothetical protein
MHRGCIELTHRDRLRLLHHRAPPLALPVMSARERDQERCSVGRAAVTAAGVGTGHGVE